MPYSILIEEIVKICEHPDITYEVGKSVLLPFRFVIHELRCTVCDSSAAVIYREKVR